MCTLLMTKGKGQILQHQEDGLGSEMSKAKGKSSSAGSWYQSRAEVLSGQLEGWLSDASSEKASTTGPVRAIIAPHAGYRAIMGAHGSANLFDHLAFSYSGPTAAHAYVHLDAGRFKRIFILGPSHHVHLDGCAVSGASVCETPVGDLEVDVEVRSSLLANPAFELMGKNVDEDEHSIEMHLPYVAKLVAGRDIKIVPIMVGSISPNQEAQYGRLLAPYLEDPANFFVISSDFCHWGSRFRYQPFDKNHGEIGDYIEWLDRQGMELIEEQDASGFTAYLGKHRNTICGRHPISVLLQAIKAVGRNTEFAVRFVRYAQSTRCKHKQDSSVSYASAIAEVVKPLT